MNRDHASNHVDDRSWHEKRRDPPRTLGDHFANIFFDHRQTTDARSDIHTDAFGIAFGNINSRIVDRHFGGGEPVVYERIHSPHFFGRHPLRGIEILDFASNARRQHRRIEMCDRPDTAAAIDHVIPCLGNSISDGRDNTETRDDDASF